MTIIGEVRFSGKITPSSVDANYSKFGVDKI